MGLLDVMMNKEHRTDSQTAEAEVREEGRDMGLFCGKERRKPRTPWQSSKAPTSVTWTPFCVWVQVGGVL